MSKAKPRLQALIKMTDTHPSAPEPLQSAFLMSRYSAMNIAASMTNWRSYSTPGLDCFDLLCEEPDTTAHLVKYGDQPGVAAAVATYAEWRATMAELGAAALAFIVESRAELAR
ncbi:MAG TPA: hypothetical protein VNI01_10070 [Elusimicrobiota bacterium]|jgi:hypothetical protein|nr:hypothetical protein [Elusimicrobiota bacterium]